MLASQNSRTHLVVVDDNVFVILKRGLAQAQVQDVETDFEQSIGVRAGVFSRTPSRSQGFLLFYVAYLRQADRPDTG